MTPTTTEGLTQVGVGQAVVVEDRSVTGWLMPLGASGISPVRPFAQRLQARGA